MVAYLLSSSPKNGVELMDGIESITRGWWRPTPGSIYPLLKEMTEQGIVRKMDDGRYELTTKGRAQAEVPFGGHSRRSPTLDEMVGQMNSLVSYMEDVKSGEKEDLNPHDETLRSLSRRLADLAADDKKDRSE